MSHQYIGVFDSGIGGLSVLKALQAELPLENFMYIADSAHAPYGERGDAYVVMRALAVANYLVNQNVKALVVACNTATAAAIDALRSNYPKLPIIGVEPALKPAVELSQTKHIAVMATRGTLASARFAALLAAHSSQARFTLLPCDGLAEAIERSVQQSVHSSNTTDLIAVCTRIIGTKGLFEAEKRAKTHIDTIVLGCTHYPFAAQQISQQAGAGVQLIDTGSAVARQTRQRLGQLMAEQSQTATFEFACTGDAESLQAATKVWLGLSVHVKKLLV